MPKLPSSLSYQEKFTIRTYETGRRKKATVSHLLKLMHEAAMQNVLELKLSVWDLEPYQISWVIRNMRLQVERLPQLGEEISILTYPAGFERLFTYRDYRVYDKQGIQIACATSKWLLMNTENRRMAPIPEHIARLTMPAMEDCLPRNDHKFTQWSKEADKQQEFQVTWHDLDFNGHLNNVVYLNWMLEPLPEAILYHHQLTDLHLIYRAEAIWKERLVAEVVEQEEGCFLHRLVRQHDGKELAAASSFWKEVDG